ncbi:ROK family protein [Thalassobacillus sp. CUG 92003]|uniref:ROK family protein n=1 Tax=Thalassobacillus sp. CUG 92003 TaxID=2736641 RepID=UPI0015E76915
MRFVRKSPRLQTKKDQKESIDLSDNLDTPIIQEYLDYIAVGINNIINIFNPQVLIINSEVMRHNQHMVQSLKQRLNSRMNNYKEIVISALGKKACALGGIAISLKAYYGINSVNLSHYPYSEKKNKESIS